MVLRNVYDKAFVYFRNVPMGGNCIFDVGDIEVVILYLTFLDKVISYSRVITPAMKSSI